MTKCVQFWTWLKKNTQLFWDCCFKYCQKYRVRGWGRLGPQPLFYLKLQRQRHPVRLHHPLPWCGSQQRHKLEMSDPLSTVFIQLENKPCSAQPKQQGQKSSRPLASLDEHIFQSREGHKVNTSKPERLHVPSKLPCLPHTHTAVFLFSWIKGHLLSGDVCDSTTVS